MRSRITTPNTMCLQSPTITPHTPEDVSCFRQMPTGRRLDRSRSATQWPRVGRVASASHDACATMTRSCPAAPKLDCNFFRRLAAAHGLCRGAFHLPRRRVRACTQHDLGTPMRAAAARITGNSLRGFERRRSAPPIATRIGPLLSPDGRGDCRSPQSTDSGLDRCIGKRARCPRWSHLCRALRSRSS